MLEVGASKQMRYVLAKFCGFSEDFLCRLLARLQLVGCGTTPPEVEEDSKAG